MGAEIVGARRGLALSLLLGFAASVACTRTPKADATAGAPPRRVVSLAPSITETLVALDLSDRLVGVSDYCPDVAADPPPARVGGLNNLNLEAVVALAPDLVMTVQNPDDRSLATLNDRGVAVWARDPQSLEEVMQSIVSIGERFGRGAEAKALVARLRERLARVADAVAARARDGAKRPRLYVEVDPQGPWTIGRGSFVRDAVVAAGADNLFDDVASAYPTVSEESIALRDPDWILLLHPTAAPFERRGALARLRAVREGRVITDVDRESLLHSSPRLVDGIETLAARLHALPAPPPPADHH